MKKVVLIAVALIGMHFSANAQDETTTQSKTENSEGEIEVYVGFGVKVLGDYKMNDKLKASGMPQIASAAPEIAVGLNFNPSDSRFYSDIEFAAAYMDDKTATDRMKTTAFTSTLRVQYKLVQKPSMFFAAGLDLGFTQTLFNLYSRSNAIDLNGIDTSAPGAISLRSGQLNIGPSVSLGLFQNKSFPVRINAGYDIGITNGKWKSDFAQVNNTVKEMGLGSFYARVAIGF